MKKQVKRRSEKNSEKTKSAKPESSLTLFDNFIILILLDKINFDLMRNNSFIETFLKQSFHAFAPARPVVER